MLTSSCRFSFPKMKKCISGPGQRSQYSAIGTIVSGYRLFSWASLFKKHCRRSLRVCKNSSSANSSPSDKGIVWLPVNQNKWCSVIQASNLWKVTRGKLVRECTHKKNTHTHSEINPIICWISLSSGLHQL